MAAKKFESRVGFAVKIDLEFSEPRLWNCRVADRLLRVTVKDRGPLVLQVGIRVFAIDVENDLTDWKSRITAGAKRLQYLLRGQSSISRSRS